MYRRPMFEPPAPHDPEGRVIAAMLVACPSFVDAWHRHLLAWAGENHGPYTDAGTFAGHLVDLLESGQTSELGAVFHQVELLLGDTDAGVRYLTQIGLLEDLGNIASNRHGWPFAEQFTQWFGPASRAAWAELHTMWGTTPAG